MTGDGPGPGFRPRAAPAMSPDAAAAVLDVAEPEVLPADHPLRDCEHALLTPHLAGSEGNARRRLAEPALAGTARWASGSGFHRPVRHERPAFPA